MAVAIAAAVIVTKQKLIALSVKKLTISMTPKTAVVDATRAIVAALVVRKQKLMIARKPMKVRIKVKIRKVLKPQLLKAIVVVVIANAHVSSNTIIIIIIHLLVHSKSITITIIILAHAAITAIAAIAAITAIIAITAIMIILAHAVKMINHVINHVAVAVVVTIAVEETMTRKRNSYHRMEGMKKTKYVTCVNSLMMMIKARQLLCTCRRFGYYFNPSSYMLQFCLHS